MTAAQLIHARVAEHLDHDTREAVGAFLGMSKQQWGRYILGQVSPKESQINRWLMKCREAGIHAPRDLHEAILTSQPAPPHPHETVSK